MNVSNYIIYHAQSEMAVLVLLPLLPLCYLFVTSGLWEFELKLKKTGVCNFVTCF